MAELERPHPPGEYPVVVVGTGPGGVQTSYCLTRLGIRHALLGADDGPGGMFRRFPLFERLITWTKPYAPVERGARAYEWYDWNSLLSDEPEHRAIVPPLMDGTKYFPSRAEMERGIVTFAERTATVARYGCRWQSTQRTDDGFVVGTTDGHYRCRVLVVAVGMTEPWRPSIPGLADVPHYADVHAAESFAGRSVFIVGKRNSGFELADGLLPWAKRIVLASPRPARISILVRSTAAARARYMQPYEDHVLGGGNLVLDAAIPRVERHADGYRVYADGTSIPGSFEFDVDEAIAATGFTTPLGDLPALGVRVFNQGRLPAQTPWWESSTVGGIYFAGSVTQGSIGLKKYGTPSNSAAVHGFRYNARVLAERIASKHFGVERDRPSLKPGDVVPFLLDEAAEAPELWNQQAYLARVVTFEPDARDGGIVPLAAFVDEGGPDAVAITVETEPNEGIRPCAYIRRRGQIEERVLARDPVRGVRIPENEAILADVLKACVG